MITPAVSTVTPLPPHQPGRVVTISLDRLMEYLEQHNLRAMGRTEVHAFELENNTHKADGVLWVTQCDAEDDKES